VLPCKNKFEGVEKKKKNTQAFVQQEKKKKNILKAYSTLRQRFPGWLLQQAGGSSGDRRRHRAGCLQQHKHDVSVAKQTITVQKKKKE